MMGTGSVLPSFKETTNDPECFRHPFPRTEGLKTVSGMEVREQAEAPKVRANSSAARPRLPRACRSGRAGSVCAPPPSGPRWGPSFQDVKWVAASLGGEALPGSAECYSDGDGRAPSQRFLAASHRSPLFAGPLCEEEAGEGGARAATQLSAAPSRRPGGNSRASRTLSSSPEASPVEGSGTPR